MCTKYSFTELWHGNKVAENRKVVLYHSFNHRHLAFTLFLFPHHPLSSGSMWKPANSQGGQTSKIFWPEVTQNILFPFLHLLCEKLRCNATHFIHSEGEREYSCSLFLLLWCYRNQHNSSQLCATVSHSKIHTDLTILQKRTPELSFQ